jgi:5-methyltetrahydrofolate--homocysteine methyltransferase
MLRQQEAIADGKPNLSLADFIAERDAPVIDYIGAFAVTAGLGADELARSFEVANDDYNAILVKALADRLAEAFAAYLHARARKDWGVNEPLTAEDIVAERHRTIRPGFGYPACPDHSEKFKLFDLLDARAVGMSLTEHAAMFPAASVSGLYFASPRAKYFTVGRLGPDQINSYARRKGQSIEEVERWLSSSLSYEPATLVRG